MKQFTPNIWSKGYKFVSPLALAHMHMDADTRVPMHEFINTVLEGKMNALPWSLQRKQMETGA